MKERIKRGLKSWKLWAVVLAIAIICGAWWNRQYQLPKFHDLTVELGTEIVTISDFATEHADLKKIRFVSDPSLVDLNQVGSLELILAQGNKQETVMLTVEDTTAPEATFVKTLPIRIDHTPTPEELVSGISVESETRVYFENAFQLPKNYEDTAVTVVVEDIWGNRTLGQCTLTYTWMVESFELEYGQKLSPEDILLDPVRDAGLLDPKELEAVNSGEIGEYTVTGQAGGQSAVCRVHVADTQGPVVKLKDVQVRIGGQVNPESFVESVTDISGVDTVRMLSSPKTDTMGKKPIVFEAKDYYGNTTFAQAVLWVANDFVPPRITGANGVITMEKRSAVDFMEGVSAYDNVDGNCVVTCNTDALNMEAGGTYYITYTAYDSSGNQAKVTRKVIVEHDEEDTEALVASIAAQLSDDPEQIRNYVRSKIYYTRSWGDEDPVWYGFTNRRGNCYVHAMCLKAIFDLKGIENQLIWVTNKTHYWLLVKINGNWKHIDPTPSRLHGRYSLMNDAQRRSTLSGRVWDTTAWPACE